jgi:hypothetical protein
MVDAAETNASVYMLLARSRWARGGADLAHEAGDVAKEVELRAKARRLANDAEEVDPYHRCPAWDDHLRGTH